MCTCALLSALYQHLHHLCCHGGDGDDGPGGGATHLVAPQDGDGQGGGEHNLGFGDGGGSDHKLDVAHYGIDIFQDQIEVITQL